jgi:hypothetical protein
VARVLPPGAPSDVFTASAFGWGCSVLASVEFAAARQAFRRAIAVAEALAGGCPARPALDRWPVAEASLRLDALKARIAEVTHPWPLVREPGPDLSGQQLIAIFAMRREVAEGAARVRALSAAISTAAGPAPAARAGGVSALPAV